MAEEFERYAKLNRNIPEEAVSSVSDSVAPAKLADTVAGHLGVKLEEKQRLLEQADVGERLEAIYGLMQGEMSRPEGREEDQEPRQDADGADPARVLSERADEGDPARARRRGRRARTTPAEFEERISKTRLSKEAKEKAIGELKKLRSMSPMSAEATVVRNYLEWMLSIPWGKKSKIKKDLGLAQKVLDDDHYGLEKVKDRIVEFLAVQSRSDKLQGADPVPRRAAGRRQDQPRQVGGQGHGP